MIQLKSLITEATVPNKKVYWYEYYPHQSGTKKGQVVTDLKTIVEMVKNYDNSDVYDQLLKKVEKDNHTTIYFEYDTFKENGKKLVKALTSSGKFGSVTEEGSFAMSTTSMDECKTMVKKIEAEQLDLD